MSPKRLTEFFFVLALVSVFVSWNLKRHATPSQPAPDPEKIARWEALYAKGNEHLKAGQLKEAEQSLTAAAELAFTMPAGDDRVAETLDDLGHTFFLQKDTERARETQGKAVAALLLSQGPQAKDLNLFVDRYGYATAQSINPDDFPVYTLLETHRPYDGERFEVELAELVNEYSLLGDEAAVTFLENLKR